VRADTDDLKPSTGSAAGGESGAPVRSSRGGVDEEFERRRSGSNEMVCEVRRPDPRPRAAIPEEKVRDLAFGAIATLLSDGRVPALVDATSDSKTVGQCRRMELVMIGLGCLLLSAAQFNNIC
jgi:hypothetical protein